MNATVIIPARLGSTRLPGKVLLADTGKPLVQHVVESARTAARAQRVVVATDDQRVADALQPFGTEVVLTRADHPNGTSRLAEAAAKLGLPDDSVIVNAQGDEPEMQSEVIDAAVEALTRAPAASVGTAAAPFTDGEDHANPNLVKVVRRLDGTALYFTRAAAPFDRDGRRPTDARPLRHIGVYVYRRAFLDRYVALAPTPLEQCEQLEQLRVLEHGHSIAVAVVPRATQGIDTPEQYADFVARFRAGSGPR